MPKTISNLLARQRVRKRPGPKARGGGRVAIQISVTQAEKQILDKLARARGLTRSEFVRREIFGEGER